MKQIQKFSFSQINKANFIPVIDFQKFLQGNESDKKNVGKEVLKAFQTCGFMYLKNHGVEDSIVKNMFQNSKLFFDQSKENKMKLEWESPESNRGYSAMGREKLSEKDKEGKAEEIRQLHETQPDQKESFEIGNNRPGYIQFKFVYNYHFFQIIKQLSMIQIKYQKVNNIEICSRTQKILNLIL